MSNRRVKRWAMRAVLILSAAGVLSIPAVGCRDRAKPAKPAPAQVTIAGKTWTVEIADTEVERGQGLSGVAYLAPDAGMLFVYPAARKVSYCMRGCYIPLDIAFISSDNRIVAMYTMEVEPDLAGRKPYRSGSPVQYVLETAGGAFAKAGVKMGDLVSFSGNMVGPAKAEGGL